VFPMLALRISERLSLRFYLLMGFYMLYNIMMMMEVVLILIEELLRLIVNDSEYFSSTLFVVAPIHAPK
jgi:hypothetical protein